MELTPEEQRALLHQKNERRRLAFQQALQVKLKSPSARATQTKRNWEPVRRTDG